MLDYFYAADTQNTTPLPKHSSLPNSENRSAASSLIQKQNKQPSIETAQQREGLQPQNLYPISLIKNKAELVILDYLYNATIKITTPLPKHSSLPTRENRSVASSLIPKQKKQPSIETAQRREVLQPQNLYLTSLIKNKVEIVILDYLYNATIKFTTPLPKHSSLPTRERNRTAERGFY